MIIGSGQSAEYVLNEMEIWLIPAMLGATKYAGMRVQEGLRLNSFITAKSAGASNLELRDFGKFEWEQVCDNCVDDELTEQEVKERLKHLERVVRHG